MRCTLVAILSLAVGWLTSATAAAQPAVERLERRVRAQDEGAAEPGYLGVLADDRISKGSGVELLEVLAGGPAEEGGLKPGDMVTKVDDTPVRQLDDFAEAMRELPVGATVRFTIERQGKSKLAEVTLTARPPVESRRFREFGRVNDAGPPRMSLLGVRVEEVDAKSPAAAALPGQRGAYVVSVAEGSPAAQAGIPPESVIVAANGHPIGGPGDLKAVIAATQPGEEMKVEFYSGGKLQERRVRLAELTLDVPHADGDLAAPQAARPTEPSSAEDRIERLERRVRLLEERLSELERALAQ